MGLLDDLRPATTEASKGPAYWWWISVGGSPKVVTFNEQQWSLPDERGQRSRSCYTPTGNRSSGAPATRRDRGAGQLEELLRDHEDGHAIAPRGYTVPDAVADWLAYGLTDRDPTTIEKLRYLAGDHVLPDLGARKLRELTAEDVDRWLVAKAGPSAPTRLTDQVDPAPIDHPRPGPRHGQTQRRPAL